MGASSEHGAHFRALSQRDRSTHARSRRTGLLPFRPKRARPYLYSDEEIRRLLHAALSMPCRYERGKLRPWVYYCLFGLLSVSGLRSRRSTQPRTARCRPQGGGINDPRRQVRQNSPRACACFDLCGARGLHPPTSAPLGGDGRCPPICSSPAGAIVWMVGDIHRTFYALSRQVGLRGISDRHGPRLHDMRHRFATNTLVQWYRSGQDPERRLPSCPPISVMSTSAIRIGISVHSRN